MKNIREHLRWLIVNNAEKVASAQNRTETLRQLVRAEKWGTDGVLQKITCDTVCSVWDSFLCRNGGFHPLKHPDVARDIVDVDPNTFAQPKEKYKFCRKYGLRKDTSSANLMVAAKILRSHRSLYENTLDQSKRHDAARGAKRELKRGTACESSVRLQSQRSSPKIQDSLAKIDEAILPRLKLMRAQCEQQAAKEFPVDTPDYFTVVDHITKRLLPMITRLEAEVVAA